MFFKLFSVLSFKNNPSADNLSQVYQLSELIKICNTLCPLQITHCPKFRDFPVENHFCNHSNQACVIFLSGRTVWWNSLSIVKCQTTQASKCFHVTSQEQLRWAHLLYPEYLNFFQCTCLLMSFYRLPW